MIDLIITDNVEEHDLTDEQALEIFKALISVKNISEDDTVEKRNETINKIKNMLLDSFPIKKILI